MQRNIVRSLRGRNIRKGRLSGRTRHTCNLLRDSMRVGSHKAQPFNRLGIQRDVSRPSITLAGVLQDKCLRSCTESCRINRTVIYAIVAGKSTHAGNTPVGDAVVMDFLVEDTFHGNGERE